MISRQMICPESKMGLRDTCDQKSWIVEDYQEAVRRARATGTMEAYIKAVFDLDRFWAGQMEHADLELAAVQVQG